MKHRRKTQILGFGLALALSQATAAFAQTASVTVGMAPGESAAQTESTQSAATAQTTAAAETQTQQTPAQSESAASSHTVTAGSSQTSDHPFSLPSTSGAAAALSSVITQTGPGAASGNKTGTTTSTTIQSANAQTSASTAELAKPEVAAEGAVLLNAATGEVLFGKNQDKQFYPASITKVMTALLTIEHCSLNEVVTFSESATTNLESGAVALGVSAGDQLTVEQSLYGLLLKSANEIGNGLAEHVSGSVSAFADLMNAKAAELGCKNTHFANPHGLNNENHKTTPYDMALILRAAVANDTFRKIDTTTSYEFPAIKNAAAHTITMGHKMMYPTDSRYYEGIIGGKTGYTSKAGNTLVTAVERDGVRLIAVVMKASGTHYTDTKAMLDYGFALHAAGKI